MTPLTRHDVLRSGSCVAVAPLAGCVFGGEAATDAIERDVRAYLESDAGYSREIRILDAIEVDESEFLPGGVSVGLSHVLPFTTNDDGETVRAAINANSYAIAELVLENADDVFRIEMDAAVLSEDEKTAHPLSFVHLRWDLFEDVDWTAIAPAEIPDIAVHYYFDESLF